MVHDLTNSDAPRMGFAVKNTSYTPVASSIMCVCVCVCGSVCACGCMCMCVWLCVGVWVWLGGVSDAPRMGFAVKNTSYTPVASSTMYVCVWLCVCVWVWVWLCVCVWLCVWLCVGRWVWLSGVSDAPRMGFAVKNTSYTPVASSTMCVCVCVCVALCVRVAVCVGGCGWVVFVMLHVWVLQ